MNIFKFSLIIAIFAIVFANQVFAFPNDNYSSILSGKILLDVDNHGEAWYVYPGDFHRYYLGKPIDAYGIMRNLSLGVSNSDFDKISSSTPDRFKGLILLKPEDLGRAYYVNPDDKSVIYIANPTDAFYIMRQFSLGITNENLKTIPIGKITLDNSGIQISRSWQNLGWWGRVNSSYVPVMEGASAVSKKLGTLFVNNKIKVLDMQKGNGRVWYKIDGGQYPGAFVDSQFVNAIAQPAPDRELTIPSVVIPGDYWTDLNITKKVLTLYKYNQPVMSTYVSTGMTQTPTILGAYNVWYKINKIRMKGAPPIATHVYDLPDVPWVMFYKGSYSLHGTYWHDDFGAQRSSGCTNMTQGDARYVYDLTKPSAVGVNAVYSTTDNPGMVVNNHY